MNDEPKVAIIIVNWNGRHLLDDLFQSLLKVNYRNYLIVFVDNGSQDGSVNFVREKYTNVKVIENGENLGFSEANNVVARYATIQQADYLLFLNNDTKVHENFLIELVRVAESSDHVGIVGSKIYYYDEPQKIWFAGGGIDRVGKRFHYFQNLQEDSEILKINTQREVDWITGCALLIRTDIFNQVGGFDPKYFMYFEDFDLCYQVKKVGFRIVYAPSSFLWHKVAASTLEKRRSPSRLYYFTRNELFFLSKNKWEYRGLWGISRLWIRLVIKFFQNLFIDYRLSIATRLAVRDYFNKNYGMISPDTAEKLREKT